MRTRVRMLKPVSSPFCLGNCKNRGVVPLPTGRGEGRDAKERRGNQSQEKNPPKM